MKRWLITFALILPLAELCAAMIILAGTAVLGFVNLENLARGTNVAHVKSGQFSQSIPRRDFASFATRSSSYQGSHTLTALNMPGMIGEILVSLPTTWPDSWCPEAISLESWRSLIMPWFCLPMWVLVGCGVDALLGWRRLHWSLLLIGTVMCVLFVVLLVGLSTMYFTSEHEDSSWILFGLLFWSFLFATMPAVWIRQWRTRSPAAMEASFASGTAKT